VFEILLSLSIRPRHGYGIISDVRERTGGVVTIGTSTLYATIRRMLKAGLIVDHGDQPDEGSDGPPRKYYAITGLGREVTRLETERLRRAGAAAQALLADALAESRD
jgi:DNA-binding PadR family transcriptional regulator